MGNPIVARLIGGAGTGKTTELLRLMEAALDTLGGDPLKLGFASFTRAARAEAVTRAARAWDVDESLLSVRGWFRTVHSTVYRCLGVTNGQLITDKRADVEWLSEVLGVRLGTQMDDEAGRQSYIGDPVTAAALNCWALCRSALMPLDEVVKRARKVDDSVPDYALIVRVAERYETAKRLHDRLDFTDMLLRFSGVGVSPTDGVYQRTPEGDLPEVSAWLFDEQQDASPLLDAACRRLVSAPTVRWCYVVGDPFQAIYGFAGSSAECFLAWDAAKVRTMPKSYRCPAPILELGEKCLRRMHRGYFDRGIAPADHDGSVHEVGDIDDVTHHIDPNDDWLLIARTNFQATRFFAAMHAQGKPVRWATTSDGPTSRTLGLQALYALEQGEPVTGLQWSRALELLPQKDKDKETVVARGAKTLWKKPETVSQWDVIFPSDLEEVGATEKLRLAIASGEWVSLVDRGHEWRRQADKWGASLASEPRVRVGTIHSVKGAEADNVALLTTTSRRVQQSDEDADQHDEECRIAYVAVTRAKRNLWIINEGKPGTPRMEVL
jgi:DNA helicase-2/ATP-dependent DNA helicase PcrA